MARASLCFTLGILFPFMLLVAAVGPAHSATDTSIEQPDARWVCKFIKKGVRSCKLRYRYDEQIGYERDPLCRYIKWRCERR